MFSVLGIKSEVTWNRNTTCQMKKFDRMKCRSNIKFWCKNATRQFHSPRVLFHNNAMCNLNTAMENNDETSNFSEDTVLFKNEALEIKSSPEHNSYEDPYLFVQHKNMFQREDAFESARNISGDWFPTIDGPEFLSISEHEGRTSSTREIFQCEDDIIELGRKIEESMSELANLLDDRNHENELFCSEEKSLEKNVMDKKKIMNLNDSERIYISTDITEEDAIPCLEDESLEENMPENDENMIIFESETTVLSDNKIDYHMVPVVPRLEKAFLRMDKSDMCLFCQKYVKHFSRHLERKHSSEPEVLKFQSMTPGCGERKRIIQFLRKKGNFLASKHRGIKLARRTSKSVSAVDVLPCLYCNGFYMKKYLRKHRKTCWLRPRTGIESKKVYVAPKVGISMISKGKEAVKLKKSDSEVDNLEMNSDKVSLLVKNEPLISSFASFYTKQKKRCLKNIVKAKLRELGRFWYELKKHIGENTFYDALQPENFKFFILSIKNICGYNSSTGKFHRSPTLAIHMASTLKQLCDHAISETKQNNKIFTGQVDRFMKMTEIRKLKEIIISDWRSEIKSERTIYPSLIDLTSDIIKLNEYLKEKADYCACLLEKEKGAKKEKAFNELQKCCLGLLMISNERKLNELETIKLKSYLQTHEDSDYLPMESYRVLQKYRKILIRGEQNKLVPVLISTSLQGYLELLLEHREHMVASDNIFLFAGTEKQTRLDGFFCLKSFSRQCGITFSHILTNGNFQSYIASISQIFYLDEEEIEQLCNSLGYMETSHQDYCRMVPYEIYRIAGLLKLLYKSQIENIYEELHSEVDDTPHSEVDDTPHSEEDKEFHLEEAQEIDLEEEQEIHFEKTKGNHSETDDKHHLGDGELISMVEVEVNPSKERGYHPVEREKLHFEKEETLLKDPIMMKPKTKRSSECSGEKMAKVKYPKIRWTKEQKETTTKYFKRHIEKKKPPVASEIMVFKTEYPFMDNKTWQQIKAFVYNIYRRM